ncbi:spinster family MFS transporter [Gemmatimonas phototrophica]|uniref:spinster family MFS transporter n=1 Tax=Gemmatimonas phototrophica TaxID=1379270 RepID=UPI001314E80D|nr:MFS transporter [Gemmatimonas phototrophica]
MTHSSASENAAPRVTPAQAWYAVAVLTVANVSGFVDRQILSLLVGPIKRDLGITDTQVSLLAGLGFVLFYSVLGLPIGRWVDRGLRPRIVAIGVAVWSVMTVCTGVARSFGQLFAARIGVGVGEATLGPAAVSIIADHFPRKQLGTAMSTYMVGTFAGSGVAYALGAYVVGRVDKPGLIELPLVGAVYPWQTVFFWVGLPGLLIALLALTIREPRKQATPAQAANNDVPFAEVMQYVRRNVRTIGAISFGFAASASVNYAIGFWLATFLIRTHGWTVQQAGTLQGILTFTIGPFGVMLGGRLNDAWARKGHVDAPLRVGILGAVAMLICAGLYPVVPSVALVVGLLVPVNVFAAMPWGAANAAIAEAMPPRMRGQGSAIYQLVVNLVSGALGPTAVALLTDKVFGDPLALRWSLAITTVVGMTIAATLLMWGRAGFIKTVQDVQQAS